MSSELTERPFHLRLVPLLLPVQCKASNTGLNTAAAGME